ncbi:hypothetical protein HY949_01250 [Candidatus Gottesmanbacteria bacterium]|nr:hypothetical protein [Candidatus Gottesmanbacteria bacterium]
MLMIATLISRLLDPMWVMAAISILGAYQYSLHTFALWRIIVFVIVVILLPLLILRICFSKRHEASGWDIKLLKHRPLVIGVLLLFGILYIVLAWTYGNPALGKLFIFYELWLLGFFIISFGWKMSGHAGGVALATGLIILWFGWTWWPILFIVPLLGWARVVTKNHTIGQVVAGALYSWGLLLLVKFAQFV